MVSFESNPRNLESKVVDVSEVSELSVEANFDKAGYKDLIPPWGVSVSVLNPIQYPKKGGQKVLLPSCDVVKPLISNFYAKRILISGHLPTSGPSFSGDDSEKRMLL